MIACESMTSSSSAMAWGLPSRARSTCLKSTHELTLQQLYTDSHRRTVVSMLPDATSRPSGLKHTDCT